MPELFALGCLRRALAACAPVAMLVAAVSPPSVQAHATSHTHHSPTIARFWVQQGGDMHQLACVETATSTHAAVFACPGANVSSAQSDALLDVYEHRILPTDIQLFGRPRHFSHVDIVMAPLGAMTLGYFDENDIAPYDPSTSNHCNAVYVRSPSLMPDADGMSDVEEVVAHELQHLINYRVRVLDGHAKPQENWLNEGLAFYAQVANGFWTHRDDLKQRAASENPGWPVDGLREGNSFLLQHARVAYGRAGLFVSYMGRRFGADFTRELVRTPGAGMSEVDTILRRSPYFTSLRTVFSQWAVDAVLHGNRPYTPFSGPIGSALMPALSARPVSLDHRRGHSWRSGRYSMQPWTQTYIELQSRVGGVLHVHLRGAGPSLRIALVAESSRTWVPPRVVWIPSTSGAASTVTFDNSGRLYDRVTIAMSNAPAVPTQRPTLNVGIDASLVNVRNHNGVTGVAASTSSNANLPLP